MVTAKRKNRRGKRCIAALCSNKYEDGLSLFRFPRDDKLAEMWSKEVRKTRADWKKHSKSSVLCSDHFEADCFEPGPQLAAAFGLATRQTRVWKPNAVPTRCLPNHNVHKPAHPKLQPPRPSIKTSNYISPATSSSRFTVTTESTPHPAYAKRARKRARCLFWQCMASTWHC